MDTALATPIRPGRPKDREKAAAIRRAAGRLFLRDGFERTSMDAVASTAGVSKNTVYSHFDSKQALFGAVIAHEVDKAGALFGQAVPPSLPLSTALALLAGTYQRLVFDPKAVGIFRVVIAESTAHPEVARLFAESAHAMAQQVFEAFISDRVRAGELRVSDVPGAASLLQILVRGDQHMWLLLNLEAPDAPALHKQLHEAISTFLARYGVA